jgi:hypothetical protein
LATVSTTSETNRIPSKEVTTEWILECEKEEEQQHRNLFKAVAGLIHEQQQLQTVKSSTTPKPSISFEFAAIFKHRKEEGTESQL